MKIKTSEARPLQLNWLVGTCEGDLLPYGYGFLTPMGCHFSPSTDWSQGGPIIEREFITIDAYVDSPKWCAECNTGDFHNKQYGSTPLIAAMRCYVASKLGDKVDVPEELFCNT